MMNRLGHFLATGLAVLATTLAGGAALARQLSPGDTVVYEITTPTGEVRRPTVTFVSRDKQVDSADQVVLRTPSGSRVQNKEWHYTPHDGEFPESGILQLGASWSVEIETWRDPVERYRHVRTCKVTDQSGFRTLDYAFSGALRVDCSWTGPDGREFRTATTWYWRDDAGYYLLLNSVQRDADGGTLKVKISKISAPGF